MKNTPLPPTLLRCVAGVPLMLVGYRLFFAAAAGTRDAGDRGTGDAGRGTRDAGHGAGHGAWGAGRGGRGTRGARDAGREARTRDAGRRTRDGGRGTRGVEPKSPNEASCYMMSSQRSSRV